MHAQKVNREREVLYLDKLIGVPICLRFRRWPSGVTAAQHDVLIRSLEKVAGEREREREVSLLG